MQLKDKTILLVISGGIAAYKALELIRLLRKCGGSVRCILTAGGAQFITPLSVASLSGNRVYDDLWSLTDETEMGHIRLGRESDLIVVAPASADIMAKMAHGLANDLASTTLLAAGKPVLVAPAMNPEMWLSPATQNNIAILEQRGVMRIGPADGETACGEAGTGRMSEPPEILEKIISFFHNRPLKGYTALVTSGPTHEPLDPVRYLGNRSSGKQGHAIATALHEAGAQVTLISGPVALPDPPGVKTVHVETAQGMLEACESALPVDIAVCAAAVSDFRPAQKQDQKIKKRNKSDSPALKLVQNPDILETISAHKKHRPKLVVGFAAETHDVLTHAKEKLRKKGCDMMIANAVGPDQNGKEKTFGADENHVYFVTRDGVAEWPMASKIAIARKLAETIEKRIKTP